MQPQWNQPRSQNPPQNQQGSAFLDFNRIPELPSKYPRQDLP